MSKLMTIDFSQLDTVTGGQTPQQTQRQVNLAGKEAMFCAALDQRAQRPAGGSGWSAGRQDLANVCWDNLRGNTKPLLK